MKYRAVSAIPIFHIRWASGPGKANCADPVTGVGPLGTTFNARRPVRNFRSRERLGRAGFIGLCGPSAAADLAAGDGAPEWKRAAGRCALIMISSPAGSYYYLFGKEYVVRLTESEIQGKLEEKPPLTKTYLFIIQVTLDNPGVHLVNGSHRVGAGLDVVFNIILDKDPEPLGGTVDASGGIIYLAEEGELYLSNPVIENPKVRGIPNEYTEKVNKALTKALQEYY